MEQTKTQEENKSLPVKIYDIRNEFITGSFYIGDKGLKEPTSWKEYAERLENHISQYRNLSNDGWKDFSTPPKAGQEIMIVWPSGNFPPEFRILTEEDLKQDWSDMRWLPIPNYKP